jgi:hypothetical protein
MKVTVKTEFPYKETIEEYTNFKEVQDKYIDKCTTYDFPTGQQALTEIINGANGLHAINLDWRTGMKIEKICKPIVYHGVKLDSYFTWKGHIFLSLMRFYTLVGKMTK